MNELQPSVEQPSQFFHSHLFFASHAKLHPTIQRLGMTLKVFSSLRLTI